MARKSKATGPELVLSENLFKEYGLERLWTGKRATVSVIWYSFPSNQNGSGSEGTNVVSQKIIPWGTDAEPRIYISPFALKRRIRDYWTKRGQRVGFSLEGVEEDVEPGHLTDFIDYDLFGFMKTKGGESSFVRPGPITSWGAVSLEPYHSFVDFNTSIVSTTNSDKGGSIFNRFISKEFYFSSFFINPDLVGLDYSQDLNAVDVEEVLRLRKQRLTLFFEALQYAMQKEVGGPRDRGACVLLAVSVGNYGYPPTDKRVFRSIRVENDTITDIDLTDTKVIYMDKSFFREIDVKVWSVNDVVEELVSKEV